MPPCDKINAVTKWPWACVVFLRCIEYYRGILFLTTNRVGHFDDAFMSRIHVVIRYDNLSEESRKQIWQQFFNKLDNEREDFKTTQRAKDYVLEDGEISTMEWNGREIRNGKAFPNPFRFLSPPPPLKRVRREAKQD